MLFQSLAVASLALAAAPLGAEAHVVSPRNVHHKALAVRNAAMYPDANANATIPAVHKRGQHYTGRGTWYDLEIRYAETVGETGSVACGGSTENNSARIVAVNQAQFQGACGRTIAITYNGNTARGVTVRDQCPSGYCSWGALDLSMKVFAELASMDVGVLQGMEWWYEDEEGDSSDNSNQQQEEEKPKTTSKWTAPAETTPVWTPPAETSTTPAWTPPAETSTTLAWTTTSEPLTSTTQSLSATESLTNTNTNTMSNGTTTLLATATTTNGTTTLLSTATTTTGTAAATGTGVTHDDITIEKESNNPKGNLACTAKLVLQVGGLIVSAASSAGTK